MIRSRYKAGRKWLACLSIVLLLLSLFPATVLGAGIGIVAAPNPDPLFPGTPLALNESNIRSNGLTVDITLPTGYAWNQNIAPLAGGTILDAYIPTLKGGFGPTSDVTQWNNLLNNATSYELKTDVISNDTIEITIPIPTSPTTYDYDILSDQKVTFSPPASLLQNSSNKPDASFFTIPADPQATLSGSLTTGVTESDIVSGGKQLIITLVNCKWATDIATDATKRNTLFSALVPSSDPTQWTKVYNALIAAPDPSKVTTVDSSYTVVTITLPSVSSYDIPGSQMVTLGSLDSTTLLTALPTIPLPSPLINIINKSFTINPDTNSIITLTTTPAQLTESAIKAGTTTNLTMTLSDNAWASDITTSLLKQTALLNGFTASTEIVAWNNVKTKILETGTFVLSDTTVSTPSKDTLTITIPAISAYSISADQLVTVNVPSALLTNNYLVSPLPFIIYADNAVAISGTLTEGVSEQDIVNGGKNIVATLTNATWVATVTTDLDLRKKLMDDLLAPTSAWTAGDLITITAGATVTLNSPSTLTITLPAVPGFNIANSITISPKIVGSNNLTSPQFDSTSPPFIIAPVNGQSASLSGTVTTATESDIVTGGKTLVITLKNDVWAEDVASKDTKLAALSNEIKAGSSSVWTLTASNVVRTKDTVLTITLPPVTTYASTKDQPISVSIPGTTLTYFASTGSLSAGSFTVKAATVTLGGTAVAAPLTSTSVGAGGKTIVITLKNATWASDVITDLTKLGTLKSCFSSSPTTIWNQISGAIGQENITLSGKNVLTIKLPKITNLIWNSTPEEVALSVSGANLSTLINENLSTTNKNLTDSTNKVKIGETAVGAVSATLFPLTLVSNVVNGTVTGPKTISITLTGGSWDPLLPTNSAKISSLVSGFKAEAGSDSASWAMVQTALKSPSFIANHPFALSPDNTVLTFTLPSVPGYDPVNPQKISLTIPKTLLVPATADVLATGSIVINLPSITSSNTSLKSMLDANSLADFISQHPLQKIYLVVPTKHITSVVSKQSIIGNTTVNSLDIYTDSSVGSVNVAIKNGPSLSSDPAIPQGSGKFNVGFARVNPTTGSTLPFEATITTIPSTGSSTSESAETIIVGGSKTYSFTNLGGKYSLYKLMNNSSLLANISKFYLLDKIMVETTTT